MPATNPGPRRPGPAPRPGRTPAAPRSPPEPGSCRPRTQPGSTCRDGICVGGGVSIRVVLCDDNVLVREGVRALLGIVDDIDVVGVAEDAPTLLAAATEHQPDVVVTDIKMPPNFRLEGIDVAHEIRRRHPGTGVVVLSAHDDEAYALALLGGGQSGLAYLLKDRLGKGDDLPRAIREVASGGSVIDPTIAARLSGQGQKADVDRELLDLMAKGLGYAEMAQELGTTPEAIDRMVTGLFRHLASEARSTSSSDCTPRWSTARPQPEPCGPSFPPSSPTGWPRESPSRSRKSLRSRCSSPTSAASPPSPSSSPPARLPASWADTWRPWPTSSSSTGGPSTSSRATG